MIIQCDADALKTTILCAGGKNPPVRLSPLVQPVFLDYPGKKPDMEGHALATSS